MTQLLVILYELQSETCIGVGPLPSCFDLVKCLMVGQFLFFHQKGDHKTGTS